MKIAIDAREAIGPVAGKGRYVLELIKALVKIDSENYYALYSKTPLEIALPKNCQNIVIGGLPGLRQLWLASDAKRRGCEVLFAPTGYLPVLFSRVPTVVTIHDLAIFVTKDARPAFKTYLAEKLLLPLAVLKAKAIVAVSQATKNDLVRLFKVPERKITVTLNGYNSEAFQPTKTNQDDHILKTYKLKPTNYLLFVGTLEPRKNIVGLLKAYAELPNELQQQYPLAIAGQKGWYYRSIFTTVKALKLERNVRFLGRVPDDHLPALYRGAKLFLFPSFYEGFGLPVLEALACGTPVVSSNISSLPEVVGDAGILVDPKNIDQLTEAIKTLLIDQAKYTEIKGKTTNQAVKFSWQETAMKTSESFRMINIRGLDSLIQPPSKSP